MHAAFAMKRSLYFLLLALPLHGLLAQTAKLPRRAYLGIRMENLKEDVREIMQLGSAEGILITEVFPRSTAFEAGITKGDVLTTINGNHVGSTQAVLALLADIPPGSTFEFELLRDKKSVKGKAVFKTFPEEQYPDLEVIYTETQASTGLLRIILTKPGHAAGRLPVVAFIGGMGCYSLDSPFDTTTSEVQLTNKLARSGYLCARLEKPGMGDNARHSKACAEVSLEEETDGYVQSIRTLKGRPDVDSNAIYIIGHSMGGVFAPLVAKQTALKGIIAYGTFGSSLLEYLPKTRRTIAEAYQMTPDETDDFIRESNECTAYYFIEKMTTAQVTAKNAGCQEMLSVFDFRSRAYNDQLYALNFPALWKPFTGKALMVWGGSDYISSEEDHRILTNTVNYYHPGHATFLTIDRTTHGMQTASDFREARENPGAYNPEVGRAIAAWISKQQSS
jgi:hypothetical protein